MAKKLLFICSQNKLRSRTAETVFCDYPGVEADSAGLNDSAEVPLVPEHIEWADHIFVMEEDHRTRLNNKFGEYLKGKRVTVLSIKDNYEYMDKELVDTLKWKCSMYMP